MEYSTKQQASFFSTFIPFGDSTALYMVLKDGPRHKSTCESVLQRMRDHFDASHVRTVAPVPSHQQQNGTLPGSGS